VEESRLDLSLENGSLERRERMKCLTLYIVASALVRATAVASLRSHFIVEKLFVRSKLKSRVSSYDCCNSWMMKGKSERDK
jgi:hypothetical protein